MKKLTVNGIIGKTQGVSSAANPERNEIKNKLQTPLSFFGMEVLVTFLVSSLLEEIVKVFEVFEFFKLFGKEKWRFSWVGGRQF